MMHAARRALLLVALALLTSAATASAEGAWVLWDTYMENRTEPKTTKTEHAIRRVFESQRACEQAIPEEVRSHIRTWSSAYERVNVSPADPVVVSAKSPKNSTSKDDSLLVRVSCWPVGLQPQSILGGATYPKRDAAWVLWKESSRPPASESWSLYEAYESKEECDAGYVRYIQISLKTGARSGTTREVKGGAIITRDDDTGKEVLREEFHCFPSGTDPRPR